MNTSPAGGSLRLRAGDIVDAGPGLAAAAPRDPPPALPATSGAGVDVVYRDDDLLVVDKPAGLAMHPGSGVREHLVGRVHALVGDRRGFTFQVAPAHRLDRDTSGLVVFGTSARGLRGFTAALRGHAVRKVYLALVHGAVAARGEIDLSLARADRARGPKVRVAGDGQEARTRFAVRARSAAGALLEVELETGRTHQIRVHLASIGHPVVGDRRYGIRDGARRLCLHAWRLEFVHPVTGRELRFVAPPPPELGGAGTTA